MLYKKGKKDIGIFKIMICIIFLLCAVITMFYPFDNQNVKVLIDMGDTEKVVSFSADKIAEISTFAIELDQGSLEKVREIRLYRFFNTICVGKIAKVELYSYAEFRNNMIIFNQFACGLLREQSETFFMERLIFIEIQFSIAFLLLILVSAVGEKIDPENRNNHGPMYEIKKFMLDLKKYRQYMFYAANADLKAEVANSYLNRLWWLLEPLFNMLVYVVVFGKIMGSSIQNYATFIFSALLMWNFFSKTINYSVKCVRFNRDIVTKVYVPKYVLLITNMILNFMKLLFSFLVLIPMLIIFKVKIGIGALWVIPAYFVMILISFGIGMIFLHYGVYIDDLGYAVGILLQMMMFLSGVFYEVITSLSAPLNAMMLVLNPVAMFIDTMRNALLNNVVTNVPLIILWTVIALLISYVGIHIVDKNENAYVKVV